MDAKGCRPAGSQRSTSGADALDEVEARLADGDIHGARRALAAARKLVEPCDAGRAERIGDEIALRERLVGPTTAYEKARERCDAVEARRLALVAGDLAEGAEAEAWLAAAEQCDARVRFDWRFGEATLGDVPLDSLFDLAAVCHGTGEVADQMVSEDGRFLRLIETHERWLFLWEIDVESGTPVRACWMRAPERIGDYIPAVSAGDRIHLVSNSGSVLELSLEPLDVSRWISLRSFVLPDREINDAFVVPPGRFVWAELIDPFCREGVTVIDTEEWRTHKRLGSGLLQPVVGAEPSRFLFHSYDDVERLCTTGEATDVLLDEGGRAIDWPRPPHPVCALAAHPSGEGFVALVKTSSPGAYLDDESEADEELGLMELLPHRPPEEPRVVPGSCCESSLTFAVALEDRLLFLLAHVDDRSRLLAFFVGPDGLKELWSVETSPQTTLTQDRHGRHVVAIAPTESGMALTRLGRSQPLDTLPESGTNLRRGAPYLGSCAPSALRLTEELSNSAEMRSGDTKAVARIADKLRRELRRDPEGLLDLVDSLIYFSRKDLAEQILAYSKTRFPSHPRLALAGASIQAIDGAWGQVMTILAPVDPSTLGLEHACHFHHLRGLAQLHAGDPQGALENFSKGEQINPDACHVRVNLDAARAFLAPLDSPPAEGCSAMHRLILACRAAEERLSRGDALGARDALEVPEVHYLREPVSSARLAEAHLALEPKAPLDVLRKAKALAKLAGINDDRRCADPSVPGLAVMWEGVEDTARRSLAWLEGFGRPCEEEPAIPPAPGHVAPLRADAASDEPEPPRSRPPEDAPAAKSQHSLPPVGHESIRALVPGMDAAVRESARYVRAFPEWNERATIGEDVRDIAPAREFLADFHKWRSSPDEASLGPTAATEELARHMEYCVSFELHRRKLFFVDESLAFMLARTNLDIEGRALRLPFPCFGLVFTDHATLDACGAIAGAHTEGSPNRRIEVLSAYVKGEPERGNTRRITVYLVLDARDGRWPILLLRRLRFDNDEDLEKLLASAAPEGKADGSSHLLLLVLNAILYAISAGVDWPLRHAPTRRLRQKRRQAGKKKQRQITNRINELRKQRSDEDVFFLPGRIPISQLRRSGSEPRVLEGSELTTRFMVRGHWRRAAPGWHDQRLRWIEPYWKGPEMATIIEKEYKLEI